MGLITFMCHQIGALAIIICISNYTSYEHQQLRSFNKLHNTRYDINEWRIYSCEIRKKHNKYKLEEGRNE